MSCKYCNLEIGKSYVWSDTSIICMNCGYDNHKDSITVTYKWKNKGNHNFSINPIKCQECNWEIFNLTIPCGGSWYFNETDVSESLLLPQEFITRK